LRGALTEKTMKTAGFFAWVHKFLESISTPAAVAPSHPRLANLFSGPVAYSFLPKKPAIRLNLGPQLNNRLCLL
jgi:hypothetical protein